MKYTNVIILVLAISVLFGAYIWGIGSNPPGYYVDESALSYNAYLVSKTGAGEFGSPGTLYFQVYTGGFTQYSNPTHIYLLALTFLLFGPSIIAAKITAAFFVFAACCLLGFLALRITEKAEIGYIVAALGLLTPWLFEISRLVLETFFYPLAVVLFLWSVYSASKKASWSWLNSFAIATSLALLTYSYTIGRLLGPLLALCLLCFAANRERIFSIAKTWVLFGISLVPLFVYNLQHPELRTRFYLLSYIKPQSTWSQIFFKFVSRYLEDLNPMTMLFIGDTNARHHIPFALGSFYFAIFALALIGVGIILIKHRSSAWWWFVLCGLAASAVPGALTVDKFHTLRMLAYPVFLLTLTIPALQWFLDKKTAEDEVPAGRTLLRQLKPAVLAVILLAAAGEATYFFRQFYAKGEERGLWFDSAYKQVYDTAVAQPIRPIFLEDGYWGPMYIHSFWYATTEGRPVSEFVHLPYGKKAPANSIVLSSEKDCTDCDVISRDGTFILYRKTR